MSSVDEINALLRADTIDVAALELAIEAADHDTRVAATRRWDKRMQSRLFEAVEGREVTAEQMIPIDEIETEVIHELTNTLPAFKAGQKRFCWVEGKDGRSISGYNHTSDFAMFFTGPGYFHAYEDSDAPEFVVDYSALPEGRADNWPAIDTGNRLVGGLVYSSAMTDRIRRVSDHVTIGRAYREKPMSAWFTLVRTDP